MVNFAIIGTSSISEKFIGALKNSGKCNLYALLSRNELREKSLLKNIELKRYIQILMRC